MNRTTILRAPKDKDNPFTRISNALINDKRLSDAEVGIMVRILANADEWIINKELQQKKSLLTEGSFNASWKNLIKYGYIEQSKIYGHPIQYNYKIFENSRWDSKNITPQLSGVIISGVINEVLITTNIINNPETNLTGGVEHHRNEVEVRHPNLTKPEKPGPEIPGPDTGPRETENYDAMLDQLWKQVIEKGI